MIKKLYFAFTAIICVILLFMNWIKVDWLSIYYFTGINTNYGLVWLLLFVAALIFSLAANTNRLLCWSTFICFTVAELILIYFFINAKTVIATGTKVSGLNIDQYISFESVDYIEMMFAGLGVLISFLFLMSPLEVNNSQFKQSNNIREELTTTYSKPEKSGGKFILVCLFICLAIIGWALVSTNNKKEVDEKNLKTHRFKQLPKNKKFFDPVRLLTTNNKTFSLV